MNETRYVVVLITTPGRDEADTISRLLLERKKAACVNVVSGIASAYWWEGKIESGTESLLVVKTRSSLLPEIIELVKSVHSYRVPEIIALLIVGGNPEYLDWIEKSTG